MTDEKNRDLFWLHIKKSAGQSTRAALSPLYREVDRSCHPKTFIQATPSEYNDILNNYRVPLGDYQFRRALFAKKFLYGENWDHMVKFAFSRDPVSRAVSAFYQFFGGRSKEARKNRLLFFTRHRRLFLTKHSAFDAFLDMIAECRESPSAYRPYGLHFSTHTAAMWDDVTDDNGNILLDYIFRLEHFREAINQIREACGCPPADEEKFRRRNCRTQNNFTPDRAQKNKIELLYGKDFEIYEGTTYTKKV